MGLSATTHLQAFLDDTRAQITIEEIPPIRQATLARKARRRVSRSLAAMARRSDSYLTLTMSANFAVQAELLRYLKTTA